ncbi:cysteine hydrolase [candidate division WS5 bacterium]|uniref:Cysteine hydrolase n=1 Tax=candidate division WS5 bacterium TaxID=2093353 RepID=A0A419DAH3_9BACT|nr:MAG: cysteine hydrolase [candidate division WS5 bacterium]
MKKALLLIDYENEWVDKNSDYYVGDIADVIDKTNKLIKLCRTGGYKIIFTTHYEEGSDGAFSENSKNVELITDIDKKGEDVLIKKKRISPFYKTNLEDELRGASEIVIAGILTNLCVRSAIQDAYDRGFKIKVIKDCCVSFDNKTQEFTFKDLKDTREEIEFLNLHDFQKNEN